MGTFLNHEIASLWHACVSQSIIHETLWSAIIMVPDPISGQYGSGSTLAYSLSIWTFVVLKLNYDRQAGEEAI